MSEQFSRRDFFVFLARPLTRPAQLLRADEQRRRNLQMLKQAEASTRCGRCYAPFVASPEETLCPMCQDAEAKNRALMQSLDKLASRQARGAG